MNLTEYKPVKLGRDLIQINVSTLRKFAELQREYINHYFHLNREFVADLPRARNLRTLMELQRDYNELVLNDVLDATEDNITLLRHALVASGSAVRDALYAEAANDDAHAASEEFHNRIRSAMENQPSTPVAEELNGDVKVSTLKI